MSRSSRVLVGFAIAAAASLATAGCTGTGSGTIAATSTQPGAATATSTVVVTQTEAASVEATADSNGVVIPSRPNRDDANVDARDFVAAPGEYTFKSPSGNVWCAIRPNETVPELQFGCQTGQSVPGPGGQTCGNTATSTYAVRIEASTIHFCTNQGIYTAQHQPVLGYGKTIVVMGDACTSSEAGIACWRSDHGFMISRDVNLTIS